jgi:hypothetical protein
MSTSAAAGDPDLQRAHALAGEVGRTAREQALELLTAHTAAVTDDERAAAVHRVLTEIRGDEPATVALVRALASYGAGLAEAAVALTELPLVTELTPGLLIGGLARSSLTIE